ncbi:MAG: VOC family protein [Chloroflexi bacterium]|nr:MAG: VOC family protein [Chloroflexota bacterium]
MARLLAVGHVGLTVRDLARAERFYRETIGFRPVAYHEGVIAIFAVGDTQTDLFLMPGEPHEAEIDLISDDVDAMHTELVARGVECDAPRDEKRSGHRSFTFVDSEGNRVAVTSGHPR